MVSLLSYLGKGAGMAILALAMVCLFYVAVHSVPRLRHTKIATLKFVLVLWYFIMLELVCLGKDVQDVNLAIRMMNFVPFVWVKNCVDEGWIALWQISLNFAVYITLGIIISYALTAKSKRTWRVFALIISVSIVNEAVQYAFALGVADIDDLCANTLGGLWGAVLYSAWEKRRDKRSFFKVLMPAALPPVLICTVAVMYALRPYGYISEDFRTDDLHVQTIDCTKLEDQLCEELAVYRTEMKLTKKEQQELCKNVFAAFGQTLDPATYDPYDTLVVYHGTIPAYYIWSWDNGAFTLYTMESGVALPQSDIPPDERILALLANMGVKLPNDGVLEESSAGDNLKYSLKYNYLEENGVIYDGEITWIIKDDTLYELDYNVLTMKRVRAVKAKSSADLSKAIANGRVSVAEGEVQSVDSLVCVECALDYELDTKGLYRPIYYITCLADGGKVVLKTAAA